MDWLDHARPESVIREDLGVQFPTTAFHNNKAICHV